MSHKAESNSNTAKHPMTDMTPELTEALNWFVKLRDTRADDGLRQRFDQWHGADPRNAAAWQEAEALWNCFDPVEREISTLRKRDATLNRRAMLGMLSGAAVIGAGGWYVTRPAFWADVTTAPGQMHAFNMADGSRVELGGRSALAFDETLGQRSLEVLSGEAFVTVQAGSAPLRMQLGGAEVLSQQAEVNLKLAADRAQLSVGSGVVQLRLANATGQTVEAGQQVSFDESRLLAQRQVDRKDIGAWRQGRLVFQAEPLRNVLHEISRYRGGRIIAAGEGPASIPVTAVFDAKQPDSALDTIVGTLGLKQLDLPAGVTVIYA